MTPPPAGARITREDEEGWRVAVAMEHLRRTVDAERMIVMPTAKMADLLSALTAARAVAEALERIIGEFSADFEDEATPEQFASFLADARAALAEFRERVEGVR